eukprot:597369-Prorocentrum_minimum.AAC.1
MVPDPSERTDSPWTTSKSIAVVLSKSLYRSLFRVMCLEARVDLEEGRGRARRRVHCHGDQDGSGRAHGDGEHHANQQEGVHPYACCQGGHCSDWGSD